MRNRMASPNVAVSVVLCFLLVSVVIGGCRTSAPAVVATQPAQGAKAVAVSPAAIKITFDQSMVPSSVEKAFSIRPSVGTQKPTFAWSQDDKVVVVTFAQNLDPNTTYTYSLGTDAHAQNAVALGKPESFTFTTGPSAVAGEVAGPSPAAGETPPSCPPGTTTAPAETTAPATTMSFAKDIKPVATKSCDGCHASMASGSMANYDNIISKKYVVANDPDNSSYYKKGSGLVSHGGGDAWKGNKQLVRDWIAQGAPK